MRLKTGARGDRKGLRPQGRASELEIVHLAACAASAASRSRLRAAHAAAAAAAAVLIDHSTLATCAPSSYSRSSSSLRVRRDSFECVAQKICCWTSSSVIKISGAAPDGRPGRPGARAARAPRARAPGRASASCSLTLPRAASWTPQQAFYAVARDRSCCTVLRQHWLARLPRRRAGVRPFGVAGLRPRPTLYPPGLPKCTRKRR